jgi:hypothetical protein
MVRRRSSERASPGRPAVCHLVAGVLDRVVDDVQQLARFEGVDDVLDPVDHGFLGLLRRSPDVVGADYPRVGG